MFVLLCLFFVYVYYVNGQNIFKNPIIYNTSLYLIANISLKCRDPIFSHIISSMQRNDGIR